MSWRKLGFAESDADSGACGHIPKSPRFRSARNVAVLGSNEPRQVLTFLNGFLWEYGHRLRCQLKVAKAGLRHIPLYCYCQNCEKNTKTFPPNPSFLSPHAFLQRTYYPALSAGHHLVLQRNIPNCGSQPSEPPYSKFRPYKNVGAWRGSFEPSVHYVFIRARARLNWNTEALTASLAAKV